MKNQNNQYQVKSIRVMNEFILSSIFVAFLIWAAWMLFYFHVGIGRSIILLIKGELALIQPFFIMCFISSISINAFLFTYFANDSKTQDQHHRGAKRLD